MGDLWPGRPPEPRQNPLRGLWGSFRQLWVQAEEEEVQVRQACASAGVILRAGMERRAGEGLLFTCGKGITFSPCAGPQICPGGEEAEPPLGSLFPRANSQKEPPVRRWRPG